MVEDNAGAGEGVYDGRGNAGGVGVGEDGDRADVVGVDEGGVYVLHDGVRVLTVWNAAVVKVPPHRNLGLRVRREVGCACMATHPHAQLLFTLLTHSFLSTVTTYFIALPLFFFFFFFPFSFNFYHCSFSVFLISSIRQVPTILRF